MAKMAFRVYVTRRIPQAGLDMLAEVCDLVEVNPYDQAMTHEELLAAVRGRDGLLCLLSDRIDREIIEAGRPTLRGIANYAVGYDNIDIEAAAEFGIPVTNTPGVLTNATADMAWTLLMAAARRITESDPYTRAGRFAGWAPMLFLGADVTGRTLGIVGGGRIGVAVARRARGFAMRVIYCDPVANPELDRELGAVRVDLDTLLREADFVSLHVPLTETTRHLIGKEQLESMKPTAILINTSRGPVVDEAALAAALASGTIAGAGLDVYENEPEIHPDLLRCPSAVLAPHTGSATHATRTKMATMAAENLIAMLQGRTPPNLVTLP
jgi:glyoxylate reductase